MTELETIAERVCDVAARTLRLKRADLRPSLRIMRDLNVDSLDVVELLMAIEDEFEVTLPDRPDDPATAAVFTRRDMTLADLAEVVYLRRDVTSRPRQRRWFGSGGRVDDDVVAEIVPFTQFDGRYVPDRRGGTHDVLERSAGVTTLARRRRDGMVTRCVPATAVEFKGESGIVTRPVEAFAIDVEPVSTSAYCRFLNTVGPVAERMLFEWFVSAPGDDRVEHQLIERVAALDAWRPAKGCERRPMVLVSWYGANAYALWATGGDWYGYRDAAADGAGSALPTEDEWEYAARGQTLRRFPWGDDDATPALAAFGRHVRGATYPTPQSLPIEAVNRPIGLSPFGLRHMAGNVWQWCANELSAGLRAERGGSWIGPAFLCESGYRRGRVPDARGRCLGFRCVARDPID